jgi:hypothetical protein
MNKVVVLGSLSILPLWPPREKSPDLRIFMRKSRSVNEFVDVSSVVLHTKRHSNRVFFLNIIDCILNSFFFFILSSAKMLVLSGAKRCCACLQQARGDQSVDIVGWTRKPKCNPRLLFCFSSVWFVTVMRCHVGLRCRRVTRRSLAQICISCNFFFSSLSLATQKSIFFSLFLSFCFFFATKEFRFFFFRCLRLDDVK